MGREVRRVPADWQHPRDRRGHYVPMHECFPYNEREIEEGLAEGWLKGTEKPYGIAVMPDWPQEQRTHLMMYETCTEGTPISPAFATPEELARYLADTGASACGSMTASYEAWLSTCRRGWAPSMMGGPVIGLTSGVEGLAKDERP